MSIKRSSDQRFTRFCHYGKEAYLMMRYRLSDSAHNLEGQPMFKVLSRANQLEREEKDIVHFEIGDPDFSTPENIATAACQSIRRGETHYTDSMGLMEFRELVCHTTKHSRGFMPTIDQVLITPGANIIIYYALRCLVNPGDEVIVPDPGFPTYYSVIRFCGLKEVRVPLREENEFRLNPQDVEKMITERTRVIIINSPQNPTGSVMKAEELNEIAELAEKHDIYIYSDEIYARMIFDESIPFSSIGAYNQCKDRTIIANGFSKAFAMTGWRLGVAIGPPDVIQKMGLLLQTTSSCVSPFIQRACMEAIRGDQSEVRKMMQTYKQRRDLLVDGLNSILGITCVRPGGAFYVFPNINGTGMSSEVFAEEMLEKAGVALLPGTNFGPSGEGYVRLCYALSENRIVEGLERIRRVLSETG